MLCNEKFRIYKSISKSFSLNQFLLISLLSLLGFGSASFTLKVVGKFTACPNIKACCVGIEGNRLNIVSEI